MRRQFDEKRLNDLAQSIASSKGLLHPLVLRNASPILVAGERRLRALRLLFDRNLSYQFDGSRVPVGYVPVVRLNELSPLDLEEAELEENVVRTDLSFAELASAYKRLHDLRTAQANERGDTHSLRDTAREILGNDDAVGYTAQQIRDHILLADHLDDSDIASASNVREAMKILRKKKESEQYVQLAESATPTNSLHTLLRGDCREHLRSLPAETFSCIISDPPYGIDANKFGDQASNKHTYLDRVEDAEWSYSLLATVGFRVAARQCHLYAFCDIRRFHDLEIDFTLAGWRVWPTPLIWHKQGGMLPDPDHAPRRTYEAILYAIKGEKKVQFVAGDVISIPAPSQPRRAAEKPSALYYELLRRSVLPGDSVLDPFAGTGPIFEAATRLRCRATGIELDPTAIGIALERMAIPEPVKGLLEL